MPPGIVLRHGDILFDDTQMRLVVEVVPSEVLVVKPRSVTELGRLAFEFGNLHVPAELHHEEIRVSPDGPVIEVIERLGVPSTLETRRFQPIFAAGGVTLSPNLRIVRRVGA
jgi:urease accessory protein